jgi:hypothetical protein
MARRRFHYVRGVKHQCTNFHARVGSVWIPRYAELMFLHLARSMGDNAFWCGLGAKNQRTIFWAQVGLMYVPQKSTPGHDMLNLCFYIWCDLLLT